MRLRNGTPHIISPMMTTSSPHIVRSMLLNSFNQELDFLTAAFERIERKRKLMDLAKTDEPEKNLKTIATAKVTPIHEMVVYMLRYMIAKKEPVSFEELMERAHTRSELVASFIALLQLIRKGQVSIISDDPENPLLEINYERDKFTAADA